MRASSLLAWSLAVVTELVLAAAASAASRSRVLADLPFERAFGGIPFIALRVNDSGPLQFMVDTGGAGSIIDKDVAARLGLEIAQGRASVAGNAALDVGVVPNATLRLGKAAVSTRLTVHALKTLEPIFGRRIDGILGGGFFRQYAVELNYDRDRLRVYEHYRGARDAVTLPMQLSNGVPFVDLEVEVTETSAVRGSFLIDSAGGWMTVHLHRQVAEREKVVLPAGVGETGVGLGGRMKRTAVRGESLRIGPHRFRKPPVAITDDTAGLRTNASSLGLVGIEVLKRFNVVFDYPKQRLHLTPSRAIRERYAYDASGLRMQTLPSTFTPARVTDVVPASPAAEAGFQKGDLILEIDGASAAQMTLEQLRTAFGQPGKRYLVRIRREDRVLSLPLVTRELL